MNKSMVHLFIITLYIFFSIKTVVLFPKKINTAPYAWPNNRH